MKKTNCLRKNITHLLIPTRSEISIRIAKTANALGIPTTTLYTDIDRDAPHVTQARQSRRIESYLNIDEIVNVAKEIGADGIHPGYGFLSENAKFVKAIEDAGGIEFLGPRSNVVTSMGSKSESKNLMLNAGVPCVPGYHGENQDPQHLLAEAEKIKFPVLIKATKGGGGKGMRIVLEKKDFLDQLKSAQSEAQSSFGDGSVLVEKYIVRPRHVEVQIFGDKHGNVVTLGERDCSVQRRHQKIIEESPAPNLSQEIRQKLWDAARAAGKAVGYTGAGTVEFIFDVDSGEFYFMEMNTRLQVEHPVTEMVTGTDLVQWGLLVAAGEPLPLKQEDIKITGHSFEARIYAENPTKDGFIPDSGPLVHVREPPKTLARLDTGFGQGNEISSSYDPMISKLIVKGATREEALQKMRAALEAYEIVGPATNIEFLKTLCVSPGFMAGEVETGYIPKYESELFAVRRVPDEVFAQAALCILNQQSQLRQLHDPFSVLGGNTGMTSTMQVRKIPLRVGDESREVMITQKGPGCFDLNIGGREYPNVTSTTFANNLTTTYLPHTRLSSTTVRQDNVVSTFHLGLRYNVEISTPEWLEKALGKRESKHSVLAPMPCKVVRYEVANGDHVKQDQVLVVIESMKMETTIRAPADATIRRLTHGAGDIVKQGAALIEFEGEDEQA